MISRIYTEAAIADNILIEVDDWIEDDDAVAHVQRSEAQKRCPNCSVQSDEAIIVT